MINCKRRLSLVLSLCLVLLIFFVSPAAFAVDDPAAFSVDTRVSMEDRTVSFDVSIENNPGTWRGSLYIQVKSDDFSASGYTYEIVDEARSYYPNLTVTTSGTSTISFICTYDTGGDTVNYNGKIFTLTIPMADDIMPGEKIVSTLLPYIWTQAGYTNSTGRVSLVKPIISCVIDDFGPTLVESITITPESKTIKTTEKNLQLAATVLPENATNKAVTWTSSNTDVATVNAKTGLVTVTAAGDTTITATATYGTSDAVTGVCEITVEVGVQSILLIGEDGAPALISVGETVLREPIVTPENAANKTLSWTSSNTGVATVDEDGEVTAVAPGLSLITATSEDGGKSASYRVAVTEDDLTANAARVGEETYDTLEEAIEAAASGDTVYLLRDYLCEYTSGYLTINLKDGVSLDLGGNALVGSVLVVPEGATVPYIRNGAIYGGGGTFGSAVQVAGTLDLIEDCEIDAKIGLYVTGLVSAVEDCVITTTSYAFSANASSNGASQGTINNVRGCIANPGDGIFLFDHGKAYGGYITIYSGQYGGKVEATLSQYITLYGGQFKDRGVSYCAAGLTMTDEPNENGYYEVIPGEAATGTLTITVTPAEATVALKKSGESEVITPDSSSGGSFVYTVELGAEHDYTVSHTGYDTKTGSITPVHEATVFPISLNQTSGGGQTPTTVKGGDFITSGGTYEVEGAGNDREDILGTITITTRDAVTLVGKGISGSGNMYSGLTIDCASGANLTIQDLWVNNNFGQGTASGDVHPGQNIIIFTGSGNTLSLQNESLLENQEYVQGAGIYVPKGTSLTIDGPGTLYLYKYSQGAGIGGNSNEASGSITFAGGQIFIKGSKTGPLIGGDLMTSATNSIKNDDIYFTGGEVFLVNIAQGAAIGSSKQGTCAGNVYLTGGNLTIVSSFIGSAIGYGGNASGDPGTLIVTGGSFKAVRTGNSIYGNSVTDVTYIDDSLVTAKKQDNSGNEVRRLIFDTVNLSSKANSFTVSSSTGLKYSGGLHSYIYTASTTTVNNFTPSSADTNLYFYLPMKAQTLTINNETFDVTWDDSTNDFVVKKGDTIISGGTASQGEITTSVPIESTTTVTNGKATTTVTEQAVTTGIEAAAKAGEKGLIIKADTEGKEAVSTTFSVPKASAQAIAKADLNLTVEAADGSRVTLTPETMNSLSGQADGSALAINVTHESKQTAADIINAAKQLDGMDVDLDNSLAVSVTVTSGGKDITSFTGSMAIDLPVDSTKYTVGGAYKVYQISADGSVEVITGTCVKADGIVYVRVSVSHLSTFVVSNEKTLDYNDVKVGAWYYDAVAYVTEKGLMNGTGDKTFSPESNMTRAMLVTVLYRLEGKPDVTAANAFTDVDSDEWYTDAVIWASANDIVDGYGNGVFGTNDNVTREQMAAILYRYASYKGYDVAKVNELSAYTDAESIASYALAAMRWSNAEGLITGRTATTLAPDGTATRAEVATILMRFAENVAK